VGRYLVELDDVGVPQDLEDADLASHPLHVGLLHDLLLLEDLDGHLLLGRDVDAQLDLPEGSLAQRLACRY
jgi:hypothetical protein